jgi:hypothetical protein
VTIGLPGGAVAPVDLAPVAPLLPPANLDAAISVEALRARLFGQTGFFFCAHCLARELAVSTVTVREAMWTLEQDATFQIRVAQCVGCLMVKRVIRHERLADELSGTRRVLQFILANERAHCASCLAFATDLPLADARRALVALEGAAELERREVACEVCGRWQSVIARSHTVAPDEAREAELGDVVSGRVRYRSCRIDLLSFRTGDGWRPLALIKTAIGAILPDAPTILLGIVPTKLEADELAASEARAWLDKRFP